MTTTLQIVADDLSTVLLDLNSTNTGHGDVTWALLSDVDFGTAYYDHRRTGYTTADGGMTTRSFAALSPVTFRVVPTATSYDNLAEGINRLASLLALGGTLKWVPNGSSNARYRDFEPSDTPVLFEGRELGVYRATTLFSRPDGVTLQITAQPFFYGAKLDSDDNLLTNATLSRDVDSDTAPDGWTVDLGTWTIDADAEAAEVAYTGTGGQNLARQQVSGAETTTYTFSCDVRRISGTGTAGIRLRSVSSLNAQTSSGVSSSSWTRLSISHSIQAGDTAMRADLIQVSGTSGESVYQFRDAQLELGSSATPFHVGTETFNADPETDMGRVVLFYNPGSAPVPVRLKAQPVTPSQITAYRVALLPSEGVEGRNSVSLFASNRYAVQAESMDAGLDTSLYVGGSLYSGDGSNTMRTTFASNTMTTPRLEKTLTNNVEALAGHAWRLWVRVGISSSQASRFTIRPFVGGVTLNDVEVSIYNTGGYDVPLGTFYVEEDALDIRLGVRATRDTGTNLLWDCFFFEPIDHGVGVLESTAAFSPSGSDNLALASDPAIPGARVTTGIGGQVSVGKKVAVSGPVPFVASPGLTAVYIVGTLDMSTTGATHDQSIIGSQTVGFEFYPRYHA